MHTRAPRSTPRRALPHTSPCRPPPPAQLSAWVTGSGVAGAGEREVKVKSSSGLGAGCGCSLGCAAVPRGRSSRTLLPHRRTCPRRSAPQPGPHRRRPPRTALCGLASPRARGAGRWRSGAAPSPRPRAGFPSTSHTAKRVSNARLFLFSFWSLFEAFPPPVSPPPRSHR